MDPVSQVGQLAEVLRKQLAEAQKANTAAGTAAPAAAAGARPAAAQAGLAELRKKIADRIRRIDASDPHAHRKSVHVFLESVLLWEFGEHLMDDPKFHAMLDDVQSNMESDAATAGSLAALVASLR